MTQLAHPQATAKEDLDDGPIALTFDPTFAPSGLDDPVDLFGREHRGQVAPFAGHLQQSRGVSLYITLQEEIAPEGADPRDDAGDRRGADAQIV